MEKLANSLSVERTASRWIVSTDPDEHVAQIKRYVDLGFRHLVFHAPDGIRHVFFACMASRCCRGCARWADRWKRPNGSP